MSARRPGPRSGQLDPRLWSTPFPGKLAPGPLCGVVNDATQGYNRRLGLGGC